MSLVIGRRLWLDAKDHFVEPIMLRFAFQLSFMLDFGGLGSGPFASHRLRLRLGLGSWRFSSRGFGVVNGGGVSLLAQLLYMLTTRVGQRGHSYGLVSKKFPDSGT